MIVATDREAHYVLDEILGNATDQPITEHATDTHGATLINFAFFDLVGLQLSPRIRDLGKITLYRTGPNADFVRAGKLSRSDRQQNAFAAALKEWGALCRTIYAARYLTDETYRRKISRQLNKGESLHALRDPSSPPGAADGAGLVPDPGDQCGRDVDDRVLRTGGRGDAHPGPPDRGRDPGPHLAGAQRERQLLRLNCGRRRTRAGQARPVRLSAAARSDMAHANRSVHTRRAYAYDLASLFRFHPGPASSITPETLRSFFATIATIRKRLGPSQPADYPPLRRAV